MINVITLTSIIMSLAARSRTGIGAGDRSVANVLSGTNPHSRTWNPEKDVFVNLKVYCLLFF